MFNGQHTYDQVPTGKRISGMEVRKGQLSLAWNSGNNELNDFQKRKQKNKEVQVKLNYQESSTKDSQSKPTSVGYGQGEPTRDYQLQSPYNQSNEQSNSSNRHIPSYNQEEVLGYLKKYEHIDQMPQDELEKVMAYYEGLKQPKKNAVEQPIRNPSSRQQIPTTPISQTNIERREPIRPRQSAGGIIYGSQQNLQSASKPPSRYAEVKNNPNVVIGDGYNYFKEEAHRKTVAEQQNQILQQAQQSQGQVAGYNVRTDNKGVSNIRFG